MRSDSVLMVVSGVRGVDRPGCLNRILLFGKSLRSKQTFLQHVLQVQQPAVAIRAYTALVYLFFAKVAR